MSLKLGSRLIYGEDTRDRLPLPSMEAYVQHAMNVTYRMLLRLPLIGEAVRYALVERFCRVLSSMAAAGVSLPEALRVAIESLRNLVFMRALTRVGEAMLRGEGLEERARTLAARSLTEPLGGASGPAATSAGEPRWRSASRKASTVDGGAAGAGAGSPSSRYTAARWKARSPPGP